MWEPKPSNSANTAGQTGPKLAFSVCMNEKTVDLRPRIWTVELTLWMQLGCIHILPCSSRHARFVTDRGEDRNIFRFSRLKLKTAKIQLFAIFCHPLLPQKKQPWTDHTQSSRAHPPPPSGRTGLGGSWRSSSRVGWFVRHSSVPSGFGRYGEMLSPISGVGGEHSC
jgi:hypothetical protein